MKKDKQIEIKIYYKCKNRTIKELSLDKYNTTFGDILDLYYKDIKIDNEQFRLKSKYFFNKRELEKHDRIVNLLMNEHYDIQNMKRIKIEIYLDEIYKIYDEDLPKYNKLIIPIKNNDSLELYVYYPEKGIMDIEEYHKNFYEEYSLFKINDKTSFCNSYNYLFLSGGEYNNEIINDFWIIDNLQYSLKLLSIPSPKSNHTMSNINNEYILIIGGNDEKTYLFNKEKSEFIFFGNTNNLHLNPIIILYNNYLYCFSEQNHKIIAEKKLLSIDNNLWENIDLSLINSQRNIEQSNQDNLVLILENKKYYEFSPENKSIKKIKFNDDDNYKLHINSNDKNFYKLNKDYNACIPQNFKEEKFLYVLNKKWRKIHKMSFGIQRHIIKAQYQDSIDIVNKENKISIDIIKNDEELNHIIKFKSCKTILKDIPENENDITNLDDEIIINELSTPNNIYNGYEHKSSKNTINLNIPANELYEQLIHRTSDLEEDEFNNKKNKQLLHIDIDNLGNGVEDIFTPIKRDLPSPYLINDYNQKKKEESVIFEQINMENQSGEDLLNLSNEKSKKKHFNFTLSKEMIDDQIISREIQSEAPPKNQSLNNENNSNKTKPMSKEENQDLKSEEKDKINEEKKEDLNDKEKEINKEQNKRNNDLFLSIDAFAI